MVLNMNDIEVEANQILTQMMQSERFAKYVDATLPIPKPFRGSGTIKLIVLGQDPTVENPAGRKSITTVLNLDKNGPVRTYLTKVCDHLGIQIAENVYATNLYKNFFVCQPTRITEVDIFQTFIHLWLPILLREISQFADVPILALGEPILAPLVKEKASAKIRDYWGYTPGWKEGRTNPFKFIEAENNLLGRTIFPFPHQPSLRKQFYKERMVDYTLFMKSKVFAD